MSENATHAWAAFPAIYLNELKQFFHWWKETLLPPAINMVLYVAIFGGLVGDRIGDMGGANYIDFIVPGLILMTVILNAYQGVVFSFYLAKFDGYVEEVLVAPVPNYVLLAGFVAGGMTRGIVVGLLMLLICQLFTTVELQHVFLILLVILCAAALFSIAGFINALYANSFDDVSFVPIFVLTPLTYLGGVFYTLDLLPEFWQNVSLLNPILYMINAFRYGFIGVTDVNLGLAFIMMAVFIVAFFVCCLHLLNKGVGLRT